MRREWRASKPIKQAAKDLRHNMTPAEKRLWSALRKKQVAGFRFRRQRPIDGFIVDFYCVEARLVIEVDGATHRYTGEHDSARQEYLEGLGLRFLRFTNDDVMHNLDSVVSFIKQVLIERV